jgi:hypothetical protein
MVVLLVDVFSPVRREEPIEYIVHGDGADQATVRVGHGESDGIVGRETAGHVAV